MTIIFAMSDYFCIFAVGNELTLMLRQNGHNSLIITPPRFAGLVNGKGGNPTFIIDTHHPAASGRTQEYAPTAAGRLCFVPTSKFTKIHKYH